MVGLQYYWSFFILSKWRNVSMIFNKYRSLEQSYFQLQFIYTNIGRKLSSDVLCSYQNSRRRMNNHMQLTDIYKQKSVLQEVHQWKRVLEARKIKSKTTLITMKKDVAIRKRVIEFKRLLKEGLYFIWYATGTGIKIQHKSSHWITLAH